MLDEAKLKAFARERNLLCRQDVNLETQMSIALFKKNLAEVERLKTELDSI